MRDIIDHSWRDLLVPQPHEDRLKVATFSCYCMEVKAEYINLLHFERQHSQFTFDIFMARYSSHRDSRPIMVWGLDSSAPPV
jgi:hypothetical protein